ncbi:MAG: zinc chelation protein SecC [Chlamydiales bacterium]|nr:zinc chelation protein SecC [Chlamydiales bacterium]
MTKCPCHSNKSYEECCKPYHEGKPPENALILMRSRFSAYALGLVDYIIKTTHPGYRPVKRFKESIQSFCKITKFDDLKIIEFVDGEKKAIVTFNAYLRQGKDNVSFQEKSSFEKVDGKWLYTKGSISPIEE